MNLFLCGFCLFMFCWTRYRTSCRCGRENAKIFVEMDNECWKLLVKKVFSLKEFNIVIKGDGIAGSRSEGSILSCDKLQTNKCAAFSAQVSGLNLRPRGFGSESKGNGTEGGQTRERGWEDVASKP